MKICTKCHRNLPQKAFNRSSRNKSGLRSECRECQHSSDAEYRTTEQAKTVKRVYQQSERGKKVMRRADQKRNKTLSRLRYKREYMTERRKDPVVHQQGRANDAINNAIKAGKLQPRQPCIYAHLGDCSGKLNAHHDDYSKPYQVRWLCSKHHYDVHHGHLD